MEQKIEKNKKIKKIIITIVIFVLVALILLGLRITFFIMSTEEYLKTEKNIDIPIFVYHDVVLEQTAPSYMQITTTKFKEQIKGLMSLGYKFITYEDLVAFDKGEKKLPEKVIILSFDDGWEGNYNNLFNIVKELNIPIAINIVDNTVGTKGALNWEQIKEMEDSGLVKIYSHGKRHVEANTIETKEFVKEIKEAHENIEKNLNKKVKKVYTYPYGIYEEDKVKELEKEGFIQNLTDNKINKSKKINLSKLHREYPLNDSPFIILLKTFYRSFRYGG